MKRVLLCMLLAFGAPLATSQPTPTLNNGLRGATPLEAESRPAPLPRTVNDDQRRARSHPAQPPVIPHQIDNYQLDTNFNKCMSCHGRERVGESQAVMVSVTHYQDRDGAIRNEISPRRYFCTGCHVAQTDAKAPVKNTFKDFYSTTREAAKAGARK